MVSLVERSMIEGNEQCAEMVLIEAKEEGTYAFLNERSLTYGAVSLGFDKNLMEYRGIVDAPACLRSA